ncbi:MAG: abortive infection system antitoxin AbiGi family protein [Bacteroidetes bacterium]|nr:abortive infection system antitoxin AbiGi family protein [Bacteroidota bacterium]MCL6103881.1 abortive infection system antitoxin AbiGi family protein [Bacteroidota bacterium]
MTTKISENLSSNTFFHFTKSIENLMDILGTTFEPRYCLEKMDYLTITSLDDLEMAYPMVCFCDIPLSKIKQHIGVYGNYGIGLRKSWGYQQNLSPIIYTRKNARTSKNIEHMISWSFNRLENQKNEEDSEELKEFVSDFIMFTKPYSGKMYRDGKLIKRRFYDEREWRWIPEISKKFAVRHLTKEEYSNDDFKKNANQNVALHYKLRFMPDEINYLIINDESEIDNFIERLENINKHFDPRTIKRLTSRIITKEQILHDF